MTKAKLIKKYEKHLSDLEGMQKLIDKHKHPTLHFKPEIRYVKTFIEDLKKLK